MVSCADKGNVYVHVGDAVAVIFSIATLSNDRRCKCKNYILTYDKKEIAIEWTFKADISFPWPLTLTQSGRLALMIGSH